MSRRTFILLIFSVVLLLPLNVTHAQAIGDLVFRDVYVVPFDLRFQGSQVGGLSGIDYDAKSDTYYLICDDRSSLQPARYYKASIKVSGNGIDTVIFTDKIDLHGPDGKTYPRNSLDPEAMRFNPRTGESVWTSEGERIIKDKDTVLNNPGIFVIRDGKYVDQYTTPSVAHVSPNEHGARNNGAFEALTFAEDFKTLWVGLEEPLYQDGPRADVESSNSPVRFFKFDTKSKQNTAQYAYSLEPVAYKPLISTLFRVNGVTDILAAGPNQLLVIERSFTTGRLPCTVKIFLADLAGATDVKNMPSLKDAKLKTATKKLLLNLDSLNRHIDNIEGMTWGPVLANGNRSLILVSDNNFQSIEETQLFLFEVR